MLYMRLETLTVFQQTHTPSLSPRFRVTHFCSPGPYRVLQPPYASAALGYV